MSGVDVLARNLARQAVDATLRGRTLDTLRRSIARVGGRLPTVMATPPTITHAGDSGTPAGWTSWGVSNGSGDVHAAKYSFVGGAWQRVSTLFPNDLIYVGYSAHGGNGSDPNANASDGGRVRFSCFAPKLDIMWQSNQGGYRLKVDGEYVQAGALTITAGAFTYTTIQWGDGTAANRKLRHYEIEPAGNIRFLGIRSGTAYPPHPWPVEDGLRMLVHGDSMVFSTSDGGGGPFLHGATFDVIANLCGQPDCWNAGVGGTGWLNSLGGTRSTFNQRVAIDVVAPAPDVIWEMGGKGDTSVGGMTQAAVQALVETWLATVTAALPNVVVFMSGPIASVAAQNSNTGSLAVAAAKAGAAAKFPRNVRYLDNIGALAPWMTGSGRQNAVVGDGTADWATGPDGTHPTPDGHQLQATRFVKAAVAAMAGWR